MATVSRLVDLNQRLKSFLTRFDETGSQLLAMFVTVVTLGIFVPVIFYTNANTQKGRNLSYISYALAVLIPSNAVLVSNMSQRVFVLVTGRDEEYWLKSAEDKFIETIETMIQSRKKKEVELTKMQRTRRNLSITATAKTTATTTASGHVKVNTPISADNTEGNANASTNESKSELRNLKMVSENQADSEGAGNVNGEGGST